MPRSRHNKNNNLIVSTLTVASLLSTVSVSATEFRYDPAETGVKTELLNISTQDFSVSGATPRSDDSRQISNFSISSDSDNRALYRIVSNQPKLAMAMHQDSGGITGKTTAATDPSALWATTNGLTSNATALLKAIEQIDREGLEPEAFNYSGLKHLSESLDSDAQVKKTARAFEQAFHQLVKTIGSGVVDPTLSQKEWDREAVETDTRISLDQLQRGISDLAHVIDTVRPKHANYQGLINMLETLRSVDAADQLFVESDQPLEPGQQSQEILNLKRALVATGDLETNKTLTDSYDKELELAVQHFQERHGLPQTGIVDKNTLEQLNVPVADRIRQVEANLERWRWFPAKLEDTHILINIPEYRLRMTNNGEQLFAMDVVVGKPKHMTPVFSETLKHVEFAPTWTVPGSITVDELLPIEKRKPGYLLEEEIDFYVRGANGLRRVPRSNITAEAMDQRPFPYILRQRAGEKNVLGKVKFLFPNKHAVYMHDTQAKKLFGKARRAFSHGCIRLSNPDLMAYVVMQLDGYEQAEVNEYMALTNTTRVNLDQHIPVHLGYFSSWQDDQGRMHFREDIYDQDARLIQALERKKRNNSRLASK